MLADYEKLNRAMQCFRRLIGEEHLTLSQALVLRAVTQSTQPLSQSGLVQATHIDRSTMAAVVSRLEKDGLIKRQRSPHDTRAYEVVATKQGQRLLEAVETRARRASPEIARRLSELGVLLV